ncbi:MAG: glycosyltransferase 87 family protein [Paracoccaceae bacterium]
MTGSRSLRTAGPGALAVILAAPLLWLWLGPEVDSPDLSALWMAGRFLADGRPDLVYPADAGVFTMLPPPEWFAKNGADGRTGEVFPFLYPPLWAWAFAQLTKVATLPGVIAVAGTLNATMLALCPLLALRIARPALGPVWFIASALAAYAFTTVGAVAMLQNQPQIAVSFLTLLAIERSESGRPRAAGAALAMAAAIKLYPALIAVIWLFSGRRREAAVFAVLGAALALLSLAVAGWPLHAEFLRLIRVIAATGMATNLSYGLDGLLGQLFFADSAVFVRSPVRDPALGPLSGWSVLPRPLWAGLGLGAAQIAVLVLTGLRLAREDHPFRRACVWAAALTLLAWLGPVGWAYYYIAPLAFLPLVFDRLRPFTAGTLVLLLLLLVPVSPWVSQIFADAVPVLRRPQLLGCLFVAALAIVFLYLARSDDAPR